MYTLRYKKSFKIKKIKKSSKYLGVVIFGAFGLKTVLSCVLRATHLESMRRTVARITKRVSLVWIRVFFIQSLTKKPLGSRMGKGSGVIKT